MFAWDAKGLCQPSKDAASLVGIFLAHQHWCLVLETTLQRLLVSLGGTLMLCLYFIIHIYKAKYYLISQMNTAGQERLGDISKPIKLAS